MGIEEILDRRIGSHGKTDAFESCLKDSCLVGPNCRGPLGSHVGVSFDSSS